MKQAALDLTRASHFLASVPLLTFSCVTHQQLFSVWLLTSALQASLKLAGKAKFNIAGLTPMIHAPEQIYSRHWKGGVLARLGNDKKYWLEEVSSNFGARLQGRGCCWSDYNSHKMLRKICTAVELRSKTRWWEHNCTEVSSHGTLCLQFWHFTTQQVKPASLPATGKQHRPVCSFTAGKHQQAVIVHKACHFETQQHWWELGTLPWFPKNRKLKFWC